MKRREGETLERQEGERGEDARKPFHQEEMEAKKAVPEAPASGDTEPDFFTSDDIFRRIIASADSELDRKGPMLFSSGLAAGLTLGLTFLARALFAAKLPGGASDLVINLFYPIGFVIIVLGRYQLFTENTLPPVALVLARLASLRDLLRLWGIVYFGNLVGALAIAWLLAHTGVFEPATAAIAVALGSHPLAFPWWELFAKAVMAGWLVANMVWLVHASRDTVTRLLAVWLIMYLVGAGNLFHCITGSVEVFYAALRSEVGLLATLPTFVVPVTLGNMVGGIVFVALLNYVQVANQPFRRRGARLSWRAWLWGRR